MSFLAGYVLGRSLNKSQNRSYHERDFEKEQLKIKCQELENQNADLSKKVHILNGAGEKKYNELCAEIEKNKKLQEQLKEAVEIVNMYWEEESNTESRDFLEKWGYGHD